MVCQICKDTGYTIDENGNAVRCRCSLKRELYAFLTPRYSDAKYVPTYDTTKIDPRGIYMEGHTVAFNNLVKTYLINNYPNIQHITVTPQDLIVSWTDKVEESLTKIIGFKGLVILDLSGRDPKNRAYSQVISYLIEQRAVNKLSTWINSRISLSNTTIEALYGIDAISTIRANLSLIK